MQVVAVALETEIGLVSNRLWLPLTRGGTYLMEVLNLKRKMELPCQISRQVLPALDLTGVFYRGQLQGFSNIHRASPSSSTIYSHRMRQPRKGKRTFGSRVHRRATTLDFPLWVRRLNGKLCALSLSAMQIQRLMSSTLTYDSPTHQPCLLRQRQPTT